MVCSCVVGVTEEGLARSGIKYFVQVGAKRMVSGVKELNEGDSAATDEDGQSRLILYEVDVDDLSAEAVVFRTIPLGCLLILLLVAECFGGFFVFRYVLGWNVIVAVVACLYAWMLPQAVVGYFAFSLTFYRFREAVRGDVLAYLMLAGAIAGFVWIGPLWDGFLEANPYPFPFEFLNNERIRPGMAYGGSCILVAFVMLLIYAGAQFAPTWVKNIRIRGRRRSESAYERKKFNLVVKKGREFI